MPLDVPSQGNQALRSAGHAKTRLQADALPLLHFIWHMQLTWHMVIQSSICSIGSRVAENHDGTMMNIVHDDIGVH